MSDEPHTTLRDALVLGLAAGIVAAGSACGDSGEIPAPPGEPAPDIVTADTVVLRQLGDTLLADTLPLSVVRRVRWLDDRPVLDSASLGRGLLVAEAPGVAKVAARDSAAERSPFTAIVRPRSPVVMGIRVPEPAGPGDTATLRGYRLDDLSPEEVFLNGEPPPRAGGDSANYRFLALGSRDREECMGAGRARITTAGARELDSLAYRVRRPEELELEAGEVRVLESAESQCVRLPPGETSGYALAYLDVDAVRSARDGPEEFHESGELFSARIADRTLATGDEKGVRARASERIFPARAGPARPDVRTSGVGSEPRTRGDVFRLAARLPGGRAAARAGRERARQRGNQGTVRQEECAELDYREGCPAFNTRSGPWSPGEVFEVAVPGGRVDSARVLAVHDDWLAVALFRPDSTELSEEQAEALDRAAEAVIEGPVPRLERALHGERPVTSRRAGQLLVTLSAFPDSLSVLGLTFIENGPEATYSHVGLNLAAAGGEVGFLATLTHEITHGFNHRYLYNAPSSGGKRSWGQPVFWASEGVADFFALETFRRRAGIDLQANYDGWYRDEVSDHERRYGTEARFTVGRLTSGFENASSFLRHLVVRRVRRAGEDYESAVTAVARGALEGWFGYDQFGARREGLTRRMRDALGPGWHPEEAVLDWAVSQALDDRIEGSEAQNHAFEAVSSEHDCGCGWRPHTVITTGSSAAIQVGRRYGSTGFVFLEGANLGPSVRLEGGGTKHAPRWVIARYR